MQKVLIIGAGGIGSAVSREIVGSGGKVFLAGRNTESLQERASELNCDWGTLEATDAASVDACSEKAFESLLLLMSINISPYSSVRSPAGPNQASRSRAKMQIKDSDGDL